MRDAFRDYLHKEFDNYKTNNAENLAAWKPDFKISALLKPQIAYWMDSSRYKQIKK